MNDISNIQKLKTENFNQSDSSFNDFTIDFEEVHKEFQKIDIFEICKEFSNKQGNYEQMSNYQIQQIQQLEITKQQFEGLLKNYGFLQTNGELRVNLQIYIKQIELFIEYLQQNKKQINYQNISKIGEAQFEVFKVLTDIDQQILAMKQVKEIDDKGQKVEKEFFFKQQIREISILSQIPDHKNIIQYKNHQLNDKSFQIFLEYFESQTLLQYFMNRQNKWRISNKDKLRRIKIKKLKICIQILEGLQFLHSFKIQHGDIKLSNILISTENHEIGDKIIKLIDFSESGFMLENRLGYTSGYSDQKNDYKSFYNDYVNIGVVLIKILYFLEFTYEWYTVVATRCQYSYFHQDKVKELFKKQFQETEKEYEQFLLTKILSLFDELPFQKCSLIELIFLMQVQIKIFEREDDKQIEKAKVNEELISRNICQKRS